MAEDNYQLHLLQTELAEALEDIERYERVASGKYTPAEIKDKGDPIQKLAQTYESLMTAKVDLRKMSERYERLAQENHELRVKLEIALRDTKKPKSEKQKSVMPFQASDKEDRVLKMLKSAKKTSDWYFTSNAPTDVQVAPEGGFTFRSWNTSNPPFSLNLERFPEPTPDQDEDDSAPGDE